MALEPYDDCLYPHSSVLVNKGGYHDAASARRFESNYARLRLASLPDFPLTAEGYRQIHLFLFKDTYEWAGSLRRVVTTKGTTLFAFPDHIEGQLDRAFASLKSQSYLRARTLEEFVEGAAAHINAINRIHPFREGNGRTMRLHLMALCAQAEHPIDLMRIGTDDWYKASADGASGTPDADRAMRALIVKAQASLTPPAPDARDSFGRDVNPASIYNAIAVDAGVRQASAEIDVRLRSAYVDPQRARAALDDITAKQGHVAAARLLSKEPTCLGDLVGQPGGRKHTAAVSVAVNAVPKDIAALGEARAAAGRAYVAEVSEQIRFDADPFSILSPKARVALARLIADKVTPDPSVDGEMRRFMARAERVLRRAHATGDAALDIAPLADAPTVAARRLVRAVDALRDMTSPGPRRP